MRMEWKSRDALLIDSVEASDNARNDTVGCLTSKPLLPYCPLGEAEETLLYVPISEAFTLHSLRQLFSGICRCPFIHIQASTLRITKYAEKHDKGDGDSRHDRLKNQGLSHGEGRVRLLSSLQGIADHNERASQQLSTRPTDRTARLGTNRPRHFHQPFESNGHQTEARCSKNAEDDVWRDDSACPRSPYEGKVAKCDDRDKKPNKK